MISDEVVCMYFHIQCKRENKLKKCAEIDIDEQIHKCNIFQFPLRVDIEHLFLGILDMREDYQ